jgi:hypothetical protein
MLNFCHNDERKKMDDELRLKYGKLQLLNDYAWELVDKNPEELAKVEKQITELVKEIEATERGK